MPEMTDAEMRTLVETAVRETPVTDIHTHLCPPAFGPLCLWGIDELLTYHYLIAETFRWIDLPYDTFWAMPKREQADLVWQTLFIEHSPVSEACRGVLTTLERLGLDTGARDLEAYRRFFAAASAETIVDSVFRLGGIRDVVMTNDPFDNAERPLWAAGVQPDPRFKTALRLDALLNHWPAAWPRLREWGYAVDEALSGNTLAEIRRFLTEWVARLDALYMAVSLPPDFRLPEDSPRGRLITEAVLPVSLELNRPLAMMIGVKRQVNPALRMAGDGLDRSDLASVEYLCAAYPRNKFMVTLLAREDQHALCVAARKFRNLLPFGCWWFLNNPSLIDEITRMRLELLGLSMIPQHSDARVTEQLLYKWEHSRRVIGQVLVGKYADLAAAGWRPTEADIRRDVADLFGGAFYQFLERKL
ncbi:MAG: glucuronate isomerase [Armatimonadota bacterium]